MPYMTYDSEADALYVYITDERIVQQVEIHSVVVDLGTSGNVVGIEILSPAREDWPAADILEAFSPSFSITFADWFLRLSERRGMFKELQTGLG